MAKVRYPVQPWWWRLLHPRGKNTWRGFLSLAVQYRQREGRIPLKAKLFREHHLLYMWQEVWKGPVTNVLAVVLLACVFVGIPGLGGYLIGAKMYQPFWLYLVGVAFGAIAFYVVKVIRD